MGIRENKKIILSLLQQKQWQEIATVVADYKTEEITYPLFSALCSTQETCKWHAVSCFGIVVPRLCETNIEAARIIMRRLLWSLNEESGGIGWGAPEAMAEIMANQEQMFKEYVHMLISYMHEDGPALLQEGNFLELPALQQGLLWGVGRLLICRSDAMLKRDVVQPLRSYLQSPDDIVRGLACWGLGKCYDERIIDDLLPLTESAFQFNLYENHMLKRVSVGELALSSIHMLKRATSKKGRTHGNTS